MPKLPAYVFRRSNGSYRYKRNVPKKLTYGLYSAGISDAQKREIVDGIRLPDLSKEWEGNS